MLLLTARLKLTKRVVDALTPRDQGPGVLRRRLPGFGVKVTPSGRKVFLVQYRYPPGRTGRIRRYTIGAYGEGLTPDQARSIAIQVKGKLAAGIDPVSSARQSLPRLHRASRRKKAPAGQLGRNDRDAFIERHAKPRLSSWREYERMLQHYVLPAWGARPITEIRRSDVTALLDASRRSAARALADHVLAVIRKMFNWHAARDERFHSPLVRGMARTSLTARARDRVLSGDEIAALWQSARADPLPFRAFMQASAAHSAASGRSGSDALGRNRRRSVDDSEGALQDRPGQCRAAHDGAQRFSAPFRRRPVRVHYDGSHADLRVLQSQGGDRSGKRRHRVAAA